MSAENCGITSESQRCRLLLGRDSDLSLVDECRRRFFLQAFEAEAQTHNLQLAQRVHRGDCGLHQASQRQRRQPVPLEQKA